MCKQACDTVMVMIQGVCVQIRRKLRSLEGLLQFRGNEQEISHTAHNLSIGAFALQSALDKVSAVTLPLSI